MFQDKARIQKISLIECYILQFLSSTITKLYNCTMTNNLKDKSHQNTFSLIRLKPDCKIPPTFVDFSPLFSSSVSSGSILPVFNDDRCHFTPAILLSSDKKTQIKRRQSQKIDFDHKVRHIISSTTSQKTNGLIPSSNYCQICQSHFKNYDLHLQEKCHLLRLHHNEFNQDIRQLCSKAKDRENAVITPSKRKMIKKIEKECHNPKYSPKTTVYNYPKTKMSLSNGEGQFGCQSLRSSFALQKQKESSLLN